jgi:hypothetical protein
MFIPRVGDFISVRKGGQSPDPLDISGTVKSLIYTAAANDYEILSVIFENSPNPIYISSVDEVQVH